MRRGPESVARLRTCIRDTEPTRTGADRGFVVRPVLLREDQKPIWAVQGLSCQMPPHNSDGNEARMSDLITPMEADFEAEVLKSDVPVLVD